MIQITSWLEIYILLLTTKLFIMWSIIRWYKEEQWWEHSTAGNEERDEEMIGSEGRRGGTPQNRRERITPG